ncbi:MAG: DNA gyrase inhibitor YacG [Oleiphilaceae bacterium]|nr:DNA gyrase inhibitor YacG [Oleiphilaceae bacterium]
MKVNCPTCQKDVEWIEANTHRPFCSERCKLIDLGAWANEEYRVPVAENEEWSGNDQTSSSNTLQ